MVGEFAAIAAAFGWAMGAVLTKPVTWRLRARSIHAAYLWATALITVAPAVAFGQVVNAFTIPPWPAALLVVGAAVGALGDLALIRAISVANVGQTMTIAASLFVALSVAGGWVFLGQPVAAIAILGGILVLLGVALTGAAEGPYSVTPGTLSRPCACWRRQTVWRFWRRFYGRPAS